MTEPSARTLEKLTAIGYTVGPYSPDAEDEVDRAFFASAPEPFHCDTFSHIHYHPDPWGELMAHTKTPESMAVTAATKLQWLYDNSRTLPNKTTPGCLQVTVWRNGTDGDSDAWCAEFPDEFFAVDCPSGFGKTAAAAIDDLFWKVP